MSISKLIEDQLAVFRAVEKRFEERMTADNLQSRLSAVTDDQIKRIQTRIERLEKEKTAAVARYDAAIATEKKALEDVKARAKTVGDAMAPRSARGRAKPQTAAKARSTKKGTPSRKPPKASRKS